MQLVFNIEGEQQVSRNLRGIDESMGDWTPTFKKVGVYLTDFFSGEVFNTQGAVIGEHWTPRKKNYSWPILEKSGTMRHNFVYHAEDKQVLITNITSYFKYHQSNKPRRKLPRRVMMKLDNDRKNQIIKIFNEDLVYRIGKRLS